MHEPGVLCMKTFCQQSVWLCALHLNLHVCVCIDKLEITEKRTDKANLFHHYRQITGRLHK